jgi:hypothetical protein
MHKVSKAGGCRSGSDSHGFRLPKTIVALLNEAERKYSSLLKMPHGNGGKLREG